MLFGLKGGYFLNNINQSIFVMVKRGVLLEVRAELEYYLEELRLQRVKEHYTECSVYTFKLLPGICCPSSDAVRT
jgi:hypothetical protein